MISCQAFFKLEKNAPDSLLLCGVTCEYYLSKHRNFNRNPSLKRKKTCKNKTELNILKSDKGGDIVLHPAAASEAAGARGLP